MPTSTDVYRAMVQTPWFSDGKFITRWLMPAFESTNCIQTCPFAFLFLCYITKSIALLSKFVLKWVLQALCWGHWRLLKAPLITDLLSPISLHHLGKACRCFASLIAALSIPTRNLPPSPGGSECLLLTDRHACSTEVVVGELRPKFWLNIQIRSQTGTSFPLGSCYKD